MKRKPIVLAVLFVVLFAMLILIFFISQRASGADLKEGYPYLIGVSVSDARTPWIRNFIYEMEQNDEAGTQSNLLIREALGNPEKQVSDLADLMQHNVDIIIVIPQDTKLCEDYLMKHATAPYIFVGTNGSVDITEMAADTEGRHKHALAWMNVNQAQSVIDMIAAIAKQVPDDKSLVFLYDPRSEQELALLAEFEKALGPEWNLEPLECRGQRGEAQNRMIDYIVRNKTSKLIVAANAEQAYGAYQAMLKLRSSGYHFFAFDQFVSADELEKIDINIKYDALSVRAKEIAYAILEGKDYPKRTVMQHTLQSK